MRGIVSQSEQYGLPEKEARTLPSANEMADLLKPPGITPGLMKRREGAATVPNDPGIPPNAGLADLKSPTAKPSAALASDESGMLNNSSEFLHPGLGGLEGGGPLAPSGEFPKVYF